jgi:hypothetical protein
MGSDGSEVELVDENLRDRISFATFRPVPSLILHGLRVSDSGTYSCVVEYAAAVTQQETFFTVDVLYGN